jgi:hypothetical protein
LGFPSAPYRMGGDFRTPPENIQHDHHGHAPMRSMGSRGGIRTPDLLGMNQTSYRTALPCNTRKLLVGWVATSSLEHRGYILSSSQPRVPPLAPPSSIHRPNYDHLRSQTYDRFWILSTGTQPKKQAPGANSESLGWFLGRGRSCIRWRRRQPPESSTYRDSRHRASPEWCRQRSKRRPQGSDPSLRSGHWPWPLPEQHH